MGIIILRSHDNVRMTDTFSAGAFAPPSPAPAATHECHPCAQMVVPYGQCTHSALGSVSLSAGSRWGRGHFGRVNGYSVLHSSEVIDGHLYLYLVPWCSTPEPWLWMMYLLPKGILGQPVQHPDGVGRSSGKRH